MIKKGNSRLTSVPHLFTSVPHLFTSVLFLLASIASLSSCLGTDDPYRTGFSFVKPTSVRTTVYANTIADSVVVECVGPWQITSDTPEASAWCRVGETKGRGYSIYAFVTNFAQNTSGKPRLAQFTITDTDHPDEAHSTWQYLQTATRGDGSLGNAALVRQITSSDGWTVAISYDAQCRPVQLSLHDGRSYTERYQISYDEQHARLTVTRGSDVLTGAMTRAYQTERLTGNSDTIALAPQYYSNGVAMPATHAFNFVSIRGVTAERKAYGYLINGQSLAPDSLHNADSLRYQHKLNRPEATTTDFLKLVYSPKDNRCQSVDANQLLLGLDNCEPLQLISLFPYTRSTSIVQRAESAKGNIDVTTELNADRSVSRMTVNDRRSNTETIYNFIY